MYPTAAEQRLHRLPQRSGATLIMGAVDKNQRLLIDNFEPPSPSCRAYSNHQLRLVKRKAGAQIPARLNCQTGIFNLIHACHLRAEMLALIGKQTALQIRTQQFYIRRTNGYEGRSLLLTNRSNHLCGSFFFLKANDRNALPNYPRLFPRNLFYCIP